MAQQPFEFNDSHQNISRRIVDDLNFLARGGAIARVGITDDHCVAPTTTFPLPRLTALPQAATAFATFQAMGFVHFHNTLKGRRRARVGQEPMSPEKRGTVTDSTRRGRLMQRHPLAHALLISHPGRLEAQPRQRRARQCREGLATVFRTAAKPHQASALPMPYHPVAATVDACPRREQRRFLRLNRRGQFIGLLHLERLDRLPLLRGGQRGGLG